MLPYRQPKRYIGVLRNLMLGLACLMTTSACASTPTINSGVHPSVYTSALDASEQPYNLYIPTAVKDGKPLPLVLALHGKGATWESWFAALPVEEWAEKEGYVVATPHGRGDWFYQGPGERDVLEVLDHVSTRVPIDRERVYLIGHSMGGFGTWHIAASHPDVFAAIVPMATWPPVALLPNTKHLHPLIIHGDNDDIVTPNWSRKAVRNLELLDIDHRYIEVVGAGHESKMITEQLDTIGEWLRGRVRVSDPDSITHFAYTPRRGKAWWLSILEVQQFTALSHVKAIRSDRRIDITTENVRAFAIQPNAEQRAVGKPINLSVDNQILTVPAPAEDRIILVANTASGWRARLGDPSEFAAPQAKPVGEIKEPITNLAERLSTVIVNRLDGDVMLLPSDLIARELPVGTINEDQLLDIFLRPEDEIRRVLLTRTEYEEIVERSEWYPKWWGPLVVTRSAQELPAEGNIHLLLPEILAIRLGRETLGTGLSFRSIIHEHVTREKSL